MEEASRHKVKSLANFTRLSSIKIPTLTKMINLDDQHQYLHRKIVVSDQEGLKENDKIDKLPGQPSIKFDQYGGYVTVDKSAGRAFYYYFVEAQRSKDSLPLLLWLPMEVRMFLLLHMEPFKNLDHLELTVMAKHFTKMLLHGTMLPMCSNDNLHFLINWLQRFPEYKDRDFYISGESYAGHYVPQLAHTILYHNKKANNIIINLKGILIGNAVINDEMDTRGMYEYFASHALIPDEVEAEIQKQCKFTGSENEESDECKEAQGIADYDTQPIDIYNIYAPICHNSNLTPTPKNLLVISSEYIIVIWYTMQIVIDPCSDYYTIAYMNRPDVQKALT
ncbi:hypothetical protein HAX54_052850 [Datura stramonium]|uniref:Carboxypeptidase n=1 Tax=Datura stramonium TaxID=4076 RepID=A0ABS8SZI9_DATST|nr:hypothetical protein [Datura stramonium]